jgi:hypothetical protein
MIQLRHSTASSSRRSILAAALFCASLLSALGLPCAAWAQNDVGSIVGFVTDNTGAAIPGATITVMNDETGETRSVKTDARGHYVVPTLQPTVYSVSVEATGFQRFTSTGNTLPSNSTVEVDAHLRVGSVSQVVEVTATASVLQTQSAAVQSEVTGKQVQDQELNGRNPLLMAQLVPGVSATSTLGDFNYNAFGGSSFNVNGARSQDTRPTIDGAPALRTRADGQVIAGANVDSVEEIQVLTADYAAEYGGASGAQIRVVTRGGTSNFHGDAYEYLRNSVMNANTWTRNLTPATRFASPFVYNNFGFAIGGPIWAPKVPFLDGLREKLFFFVNEDWIRYRLTSTITAAVPTALMRQGNFSELLQPNPWYATGTKIYVPGTCPKVGNASCVPYQNNTITSGLSVNGLALMNAYPTPTPGFQVGTANWEASAGTPVNQRKGQINIDLIPTQNNHIEFRRSDDSFYQSNPFNQNLNLVPDTSNRPNQTDSLGWTWAINAKTSNEAHFSVSIDEVYTRDVAGGRGYDRGALGITFPYVLPGQKSEENKIPTVTLPTFQSLAGGPYPSHSGGVIYAGSESFTRILRDHTLKAGFYFDYQGENDNDQINSGTVPSGVSNQNGNFTLTDARTGLGGTSGVGLANLALGLADSYTEIGPRAFTVWRGKMFEYFAQDDWQLNSRLHLSYGARVSSIFPYYAKWANADYFDPASYTAGSASYVSPSNGLVTLGTGNPYDGIVDPGFSAFPASALVNNRVLAANPAYNQCAGSPCNGLFAPNLPKGYYNTYTEFQPRVGVAYQVYPHTVVRSGAGRFVTNKGLLDNIFPGGNSPFQPTITVTNVSVDNPGAALTNTTEPAITLTTMNRQLPPPSRWNWNLAVQQEFPAIRSTSTISYVGARGLHNWNSFEINQPTVGALTSHPGVNVNALRPYQGFSSITQERAGASSVYHSLQASWRTQAKGSLFSVAYTWAKSMDNSSTYKDIMPDTYNISNLWAPSEYDIRHVLIVNYIYTLPFFAEQHGLAGRLLGGLSFSGDSQFQTGTPCGVGTNNDYAGVGEYGAFGCGTEGQFWVQHGTSQRLKGFACPAGTGPKWFTTTNPDGSAIYTAPATGTFNLQRGVRDTIYAPGLQNWNIALIKLFPLYHEHMLEFRAEAYNFINHPNLAAPSFTPTSSQFGEVTAKTTSNPRNLQVGLRYRF